MLVNKELGLRLPIIDISSPDAGTAKQILVAAAEHGFFYVRSKGLAIDAMRVNDMFTLVSFPSSSRESHDGPMLISVPVPGVFPLA